jgi:hypothetical protein
MGMVVLVGMWMVMGRVVACWHLVRMGQAVLREQVAVDQLKVLTLVEHGGLGEVGLTPPHAHGHTTIHGTSSCSSAGQVGGVVGEVLGTGRRSPPH